MAIANWLVILLIVCPPTIKAFNWTIKDDTSYLAEVTLFVVREHLSEFTSTVVIRDRSIQPESRIIHGLLLDYLLRHLQGTMPVQLCIHTNEAQPWDYYIFIVDSFDAFRRLRWMFPGSFHDRQFYFLIILTKYKYNVRNDMLGIFRLCYDFNVINVNLIVDYPQLGVCMFTYSLYNEYECRVVQPVLYFRFNQRFENLKTLFPRKLTNFYGCPIKVAARIVEPMLLFDGNASNPKPIGRWENLHGLEGMLLRTIAESLNFSIDLAPFAERALCMGQLYTRKVDVAFGAFSTSDPDRWAVSQSKPYHHAPFVYLLRGGHLLGPLGRLATPFNYRVWILILFLLICGAVTIKVLQLMKPSVHKFVFGENNDSPMANFVAVFLGYPIARTPGRNFARYILLLWLLLTLVIRNAYQGSLYDAIRMNKFIKTPTGFDDLMKWNYTLLLSSEIIRANIFPQSAALIEIPGTYVDRIKILEGTREKYATVTLRDNYVHYIGEAYKNGSDLIMVNEVVCMYQIVMFFQKRSIYLASFNRKLQALISSGIAGRIASYFTSNPALFWKYKQGSSTTPLTYERLSAVFMIYVILMIMALIVFGFELLSVYSARLRRIIEFIN